MQISTDQEFNRASIAAVDFEKAIEFATAAMRHPANAVEYEALLFSALVCYVRPFSENEKSIDSPATSKLGGWILRGLTRPERALHHRSLLLRNKALAHSEAAMNPTRLDHWTGIAKSRPFSLLSPPFALREFVDLATKIEDRRQRARAASVLGVRRAGSENALDRRRRANMPMEPTRQSSRERLSPRG